MPECGCSPKPLKGIPLSSKRSRKTKGFSSSPKSDGLIRRVMGPWLLPLVRRAIRRTGLRASGAARFMTVSSESGRGGGGQEIADGLAGAFDGAGRRLWADLQAFEMDEGDIVEAEEGQHRAEIGRLEIHVLARAAVAVDEAAAGDDEDLAALQQPLGPGGAIAEGAAGAGDMVDPGLQRGGDREIIHGHRQHDDLGLLDLLDQRSE